MVLKLLINSSNKKRKKDNVNNNSIIDKFNLNLNVFFKIGLIIFII